MNISVLVVILGLIQPATDMPTIEVRPHVQVLAAIQQRAREFMDDYFRHLSGPDALSKFKQDYAATLTTMARW